MMSSQIPESVKRQNAVQAGTGERAYDDDDGSPVFRLSSTRFVHVGKWASSSEPYFMLAEWVQEPDGYWNRSGKEVCLKMLELKNLAGLILSGEADFCSDEPTSELHWLGSAFYFSWSVFKDMNLASIRRYHVCENGFHQPTKVGLSFGVRLFDSFKGFLMTGRLFEEVAKLWPEQPLLEFGHDAAVRKRLVQILKNNFGKNVEKGDIPSECQWAEAEKTIKDDKFVQACLLRFALPTFKQIVELDVDGFLMRERLTLRKIGC